MVVGMYSVMDSKSGAFMAPFSLANDAMAMRAFGDTCADERSMFNRHPSDFFLYRLGQFDDSTGEMINETPKVLCKAADYMENK